MAKNSLHQKVDIQCWSNKLQRIEEVSWDRDEWKHCGKQQNQPQG
jgi:hypothetical protein